jgi:hypothetical protein
LSAASDVIVTKRPAANNIATLAKVFHIRSPNITVPFMMRMYKAAGMRLPD